MSDPELLRVLLVDDEVGGLVSMRTALASVEGVEIVGECTSLEDAVEQVRALAPDLAFVDIRLGDGSGLELAGRLPPADRPHIVFVTAFGEHAVDAFDLNAVDYVVKPYHEERLQRAVRRVRRRQGMAPAPAPAGSGPRGHEISGERLMVRSGDSIRFVKTDDIERLESDGNYVVLHSGGTQSRIRSTLRGLLERLDPIRFVRVHRSHAVNLDHVEEIQSWFGGDYLVMMRSGDEVRMSRNYRDAVLG